jgi:hypothetical protein
MNAISKLNEWCQPDHDPPDYTYQSSDDGWKCILKLDKIHKRFTSNVWTSKKLAKYEVAQSALSFINSDNNDTNNNDTNNNDTNNDSINLNFTKKITILLDGDQRMDCWKWLANKQYHNLEVLAFVGLTSPTIDDSNIKIIRAKSTSKDSADAAILMTLGGLIVKENLNNNTFLIVSADHILVQAALDTEGVDWVSNLKGLKEYLRTVQ